MEYIAHTREEDGTDQQLKEHLRGTAQLAKQFATAFDAADYAEQLGWYHDLGKYSDKFQRRIRGEHISAPHSASGAQEWYSRTKDLFGAYCIAGHHGGLPNYGGAQDAGDDPTLSGRLKRHVDDYSAFREDVTSLKIASVRQLPLLGRAMRQICSTADKQTQVQCRNYTAAFLTRMLYSCLVDADFIDTERFMQGEKRNYPYDSIEQLKEKLDEFTKGWDTPTSELNKRRCEILHDCRQAGQKEPGLFTLTVPTGGGKTVSSLAFALEHAKKYGKRRIFYVIPYTSIIEQNAAKFAEILGENNVLEHHSQVEYNVKTKEQREERDKKYLSAENWDAPVIVTTNVQFFESFYAAKTSRCRKLHNVADSVIIFDEAQMLPRAQLQPCVQVIQELVQYYGCTAVLCTATQPALNHILRIQPREICRDPQGFYESFRRVQYKMDGALNDEELARRLNEQEQVLCIVNTRKQAQKLYALLEEDGRYHLTTLLYPEHRKRLLDEIRKKLNNGETCRVVATSLIEAGVDVDFPTVYRAQAGLDSMIQAAGRCNRENRRSIDQSCVHIFRPDEDYAKYLSSSLRTPLETANVVLKTMDGELDGLDTIHRYFAQLYAGGSLDQEAIYEGFAELSKPHFAFRDIAEKFHLIDQQTTPVLIPIDKEANALLKDLQAGKRNRERMRKVGRYSVNVYSNQLQKLLDACAVCWLDEEEHSMAVLRNFKMYEGETGLAMDAESGQALFI